MNYGHQKTTEFIDQLELHAQGIADKTIHKYLEGEI